MPYIPAASSLLAGFPPIKGVRWFNVLVLVTTPAAALYGLCCTTLHSWTAAFAAAYYVFSMLDISSSGLGYHRLWSHRSYKASKGLQYFLLLGGTSAAQGSVCWWARSHRSHHRYTDTDFDPYNSSRGLLWTHIGWMVVKTDIHAGKVDVSDLEKDAITRWQHRHYFSLMVVFGFLLPTLVPALLWDDLTGGFCIAACLRLTVAHHSTFCINSIAHYLGEQPYDDRLSPKDHLLSAILTMGEGYHNFHHQFPMDYRNAFLWYQYDPTKWFIALCGWLRLATNLRVFPSNEIEKGALSMKLKFLKEVQDALEWPVAPEKLPVVSWETFQEQSRERTLILVSGFIHDVSAFVDDHPGGPQLLASKSGQDMTSAFFGGVYAHSNAAHNLLAMMRVGILAGGMEVLDGRDVSPGERLHIVDCDTSSSS
ncbi:hypothetical protein K525DRAFT_192776 [Schizophyllum commune Loenen D]|nr:hypothetical protein K525DRAFT_192776 [Schizophyllum commune Loenen D]